MAFADYYLCDVCGGKAFYDANLSYDFDRESPPVSYGCGMKLGYVGDMAVICDVCAKTHTVAILPATPTAQPVLATVGPAIDTDDIVSVIMADERKVKIIFQSQAARDTFLSQMHALMSDTPPASHITGASHEST